MLLFFFRLAVESLSEKPTQPPQKTVMQHLQLEKQDLIRCNTTLTGETSTCMKTVSVLFIMCAWCSFHDWCLLFPAFKTRATRWKRAWIQTTVIMQMKMLQWQTKRSKVSTETSPHSSHTVRMSQFMINTVIMCPAFHLRSCWTEHLRFNRRIQTALWRVQWEEL